MMVLTKPVGHFFLPFLFPVYCDRDVVGLIVIVTFCKPYSSIILLCCNVAIPTLHTLKILHDLSLRENKATIFKTLILLKYLILNFTPLDIKLLFFFIFIFMLFISDNFIGEKVFLGKREKK